MGRRREKKKIKLPPRKGLTRKCHGTACGSLGEAWGEHSRRGDNRSKKWKEQEPGISGDELPQSAEQRGFEQRVHHARLYSATPAEEDTQGQAGVVVNPGSQHTGPPQELPEAKGRASSSVM